MWILIGLLILAIGFALRFNPLLVVVLAALATGVAAGQAPLKVIAELGKAFNDNRQISIAWLVLPVIGLLERGGLQEQARRLIGSLESATTGRLLLAYFVFRQAMGALGLTSVGGQAQMVRPLIAPMAEAAGERRHGPLPARLSQWVRANAAATDNVAIFFSEDIFIAFGSVLLIRGVMAGMGVQLQPLQLSVWAIPTALAALLVHGTRLMLLDRRLDREADRAAPDAPEAEH
jgi:uncharacterized membrane protein